MTIGKMDVFDETQESWETYVERVQHFFAANDVDDQHKVPMLLSLIRSKTCSLLKDLLLPEKPAENNFDEIVSTLQKHLNPKPLEIAKHFRFHKRNQSGRESVLRWSSTQNFRYLLFFLNIHKASPNTDHNIICMLLKCKTISKPRKSSLSYTNLGKTMILPRGNNDIQLVYSIVCNFNGIVLFNSSNICVNFKVDYLEECLIYQGQGVNLKKIIQSHHSQQNELFNSGFL